MEALLDLITKHGSQGVLLVGIYLQWRVIAYLNARREEERKTAEERYLSVIREQTAVLTKIKDHLENERE